MVKFFGLAAAVAVAPLSAAQTQAKRSQPVRAGVVILGAARAATVAGNQPVSAAPHVWFNLNSDRWIKPASWNIYNPNAPSRLSAEAAARWKAIDSSTPDEGAALTKRHAAYWEVLLNTASDTELSKFDVLLVNPANNIQLNPDEREKLRKFVDRGGLLWIDVGAIINPQTRVDNANNFPLAFTLSATTNGNGTIRADYTQPLLNSPNAMSADDMELINWNTDPSVQNRYLAPVNVNGLDRFVGGMTQEFGKYRAISLVANQPVINVARIGDGMMVVTARGASLKLNKTYGRTFLQNAFVFNAPDPIFDRETYAAAKLTVNMISSMSEFRQAGGGSRKAGSNAMDIGAPLLKRSSAAGGSTAAPAVFKGMVIAVVGNRVVAYDADPYRDLDGDGDPDDGIRDLAAGSTEDVIWQSTAVGTTLSSASCAEISDSIILDDRGIAVKDMAVFVDGSGTVYVFDLGRKTNNYFDRTNVDHPPVLSISPANGASIATSTPNAATINEGLAYIVDSVQVGAVVRGRMWVVDLVSGAQMSSAQAWALGGPASPVQLPEFTNGATVGYIPVQDNSGGMDRVAYLPFAASSSGVPSAGIVSLWLGAKGERPSDYEPKGTNSADALIITTRASQQGGLPIYLPNFPSPMGVKLSLLNSNGDVMKLDNDARFGGVGMNQLFDPNMPPTDLGGGVISFPFRGGVPRTLPSQVAGIRIDYWVDFGTATPGVLGQVERGRISLPDKASGAIATRRKVIGPVVLAPNGNIFVNTQQPIVTNAYGNTANEGRNRGGVYGFREEGRGNFKMILRWEMYKAHNMQRNGGAVIPVDSVFYDDDPFRLLVKEQTGFTFQGSLTNFRLVGPPVVRNGQVFVMARCDQTVAGVPFINSIPSTILMSFRADPEVTQVTVGDLPNGTQILQYDVARSGNQETPEVPSILAGSNYSYDRRTGIVRFENLSSVQKGVIQNSLNLSQPITIRRPGSPDEIIEPDASVLRTTGLTGRGARWTPLLWYSVFQGLDCANTRTYFGADDPVPNNGPFAAGDTVYISGRSLTPGILSGRGLNPQGVLYAIRSDVSATDPYTVSVDPDAEKASRARMQTMWPPAPPARPWLNQFAQFRITDDTGPQTAFSANPGFLWPQLRGVTSFNDFVIRLNQTTLSGPGANSTSSRGVVGGDNALIAWGDAGLYTFSKTDFLVADEGRVAQFDPAGNLLWSTTVSGTGGPTGTSATGITKTLVKPTRAYRIGNGQIAIVDTGGNRVAVMDSTGNEIRSITDFRLDKRIVPEGYTQNEPLTLNAPRDVLSYTTYEQPGISKIVTQADNAGQNTWEYWVHYLIADAGNNRLVQVIDRYRYDQSRNLIGAPATVDGVPQIGVLFWHSPAAVSGKQFAYNSISRTWIGDAVAGRYVYVAGIGGSLPSRVDVGLDPSAASATTATRESRDGNGGVVIFDPQDPTGMRVMNKLNLPAYNPGVFFNEANGTFSSAAIPANPDAPIGNVASVTTRPLGGGAGMAIMIADSTGVYEAIYPAAGNTSDRLDVRWMLPNEAYRVIRRSLVTNQPISSNVPLRATFARRLDNGDVLVVNGYYGKTRGGALIGGEIVQLDGTPNVVSPMTAQNAGFGNNSIIFELPPVDGARGLVIPVYADRR
jgi:hypothetical protein